MTIIPSSLVFDQTTMTQLLEHDPLVQRVRAFFALFDWSVIAEPCAHPSRVGRPPHPRCAYLKALLLKITEGLTSCTRLRRFLLERPLLVLELGFPPVLDLHHPYGFCLERTVPSARWFRAQQQHFPRPLLQVLLLKTISALQQEIPGLGEIVAFDVTHIYAWVRENNPRVYVQGTFNVTHIPKGDPDCRLGVKKSSNQQHADGRTTVKKESLFGYGSGIATSTDPVYGDVILAEYTHPFNVNDIAYFPPLYLQTVAHLERFPVHITADAAFDAWYVYQTVAHRQGMAAIAFNLHGHREPLRDPDGVPVCEKGLRMHPAFPYDHTYGYRTQRYRCPLLFPKKTGEQCDHAQFGKGKKGCVKEVNIELGGLMRITLDRTSPLYKSVYCRRTSAERGNSQSKALGLERPHVRNIRSVRTLNTLIYLVINARALQRARTINASLFTSMLGTTI